MSQKHHIEYFRKHFDLQEDAWSGSNVESWSNWVLQRLPSKIILNKGFLPSKTVSRNDLYAMSINSSIDDLVLVLSILSWGGMHRRHAVSALTNWNQWRHIIEKLREGSCNRVSAYRLFSDSRHIGLLKGMGPAYFTKLIYFCSPDHDGYIMDQWTARSSNLLGLSPAIKMYVVKNARGSKFMGVSDKNTPEVYETYCRFVENLGDKYFPTHNYSAVEEAMFSQGRGKGLWRSYVIQNT